MGIIANLAAAGVSIELIEQVSNALAEARAEGARSAEPLRTKRQERNARYYEKKQSEIRLTGSDKDDNKTIKTLSVAAAVAGSAPRARVLCGEEVKKESPSEATLPLPPRADTEKRGIRLPENWKPNEDHYAYGRSYNLDRAQVDQIYFEFRNYWASESGARARKVGLTGWDRTFTNRIADQAKRQPRAGPLNNHRHLTAKTVMINELMGISDEQPAFGNGFLDLKVINPGSGG